MDAYPNSPLVPSATTFVTYASGNVDTTDFRFGYKRSLLAFYDREWVQDKLFTPSTSLNTGPKPSQDEAVLDALVQKIKVTCAKELEDINEAQNGKNDQEALIQASLVNILESIETEAEAYCKTREYFRRFIPKETEPIVYESATVKPDFLLVDVPQPDNGGFVTSPPGKVDHIRMAHSFIEVKGKAKHSPVPAPANLHKKEVKKTLAQGADYARLLRAARPMIMHVFGLFFCGNAFSIAHFDHSGINISPQYFILPDAGPNSDDTGLRQFIRAVLRMTMEMSPYELGYEPTSYLNPPQTPEQEEYPSFVVTMGAAPQAKPDAAWVTVGKPLFSSHSFSGRGTSVWLAFNQDTHKPTIIKNSWRTPNRDSEHSIYEKIKEKLGTGDIRGLATVTDGGDVYFNGVPLSVSFVRGSSERLDPTEYNRILHRVSLLQVGKRLYEYSCLEELGTALLDALHAHEELCMHGILHRDISIGNIMIIVDARYDDHPEVPPGERIKICHRSQGNFGGFLTDFDNAKILDPSTTPGPGDGRTGTPLFMASELLWSIDRREPCLHAVCHDLESFDWVALYAIYKHALNTIGKEHPLRKYLAQEFSELFTAVRAKNLLEMRAKAFSNVRSTLKSTDQAYIDLRTGIENVPAGCGGIRNLIIYASSVCKSQQLEAFLTVVWTGLKIVFEGHQNLVKQPPKKQPLNPFMQLMLGSLSKAFSNAPAAVRVIEAFDTEVRPAHNLATGNDTSQEGAQDAIEEPLENVGRSAQPNTSPPGYTHETVAERLNVLVM